MPIWHGSKPALRRQPAGQVEVPDHTKIDGRRVRLADLLDAGLLQPGDSLFWNRPQLGRRFEGSVTENGAIVLTNGRSFSSLSRAAVVAADIPAADGWLMWRIERLDGKSLDDLRRELAALHRPA